MTTPSIISRSAARRTFEILFRSAVEPDTVLGNELSARFAEGHAEEETIQPILCEEMNGANSQRRMYAAWSLSLLSVQRPELVSKSEQTRALTILHNALVSSDHDDRIFTIRLLASEAAFIDIEVIRSLLSSEDPEVAVLAAAILVRTDDESDAMLHARSLLETALKASSPLLNTHAAFALARAGQPLEAMEAIISRLKSSSEADKLVGLASLRSLEGNARASLPHVVAIIDDEAAPPVVRSFAAMAASIISEGTAEAHDAFVRMLGSDDETVAEAGLLGLVNSGVPAPQAIDRAVALLDSRSRRLRYAAATMISKTGSEAERVIDRLLEQLPRESSFEMIGAIGLAIAASGIRAVPKLIDAVTTNGFHVFGPVAIAIARIGPEAIRILIDTVRTTDSEELRTILTFALREMGERAVSVAPMLSEVLDEGASEEITRAILQAFVAIGPYAIDVIPSLIRILNSCSDELSMWAERAIWNSGPSALKRIEEALSHASPDGEARLLRICAGLSAVDDHVRLFDWFKTFDDDVIIARFVAIGDVLTKHESKSFAAMEDMLLASETSLRNCVRKLSRERRTALVTHRAGKQGSLTDAGRALHRAASSYLRRKGLEARA